MIVAAATVIAVVGLLACVALALVVVRGAWARVAEREAALTIREEAWAAERRELLDRIQAPGMVAARLLPDVLPEDAQAGASDEAVDLEFQKRPEAAVKWDADLTPLPWDLTASDDVPQPTVEPVRP